MITKLIVTTFAILAVGSALLAIHMACNAHWIPAIVLAGLTLACHMVSTTYGSEEGFREDA